MNTVTKENPLCVICYDRKVPYFECETCTEGKYCLDCWIVDDKDCIYNANLTKAELEECLSCPICRTVNWKKYLSYIIDCTLTNPSDCRKIDELPAWKIFYKNYDAENYPEDSPI